MRQNVAESPLLRGQYRATPRIHLRLSDDTLTISFDKLDGRDVTGQFVGTFSNKDTLTGRWEWAENGRTNGYDVTYTRQK